MTLTHSHHDDGTTSALLHITAPSHGHHSSWPNAPLILAKTPMTHAHRLISPQRLSARVQLTYHTISGVADHSHALIRIQFTCGRLGVQVAQHRGAPHCLWGTQDDGNLSSAGANEELNGNTHRPFSEHD
ncbi:hypothetical protein E2C01_046492 [Portunus trituberculatus]|uniref:Uncharacterized protein n=1 Tax=Portunus trituberculatus TaxID=210409 RepID=A0A5B7G4X8_PORTR|nr:hypothetical protein [Portunus trituberculatus]